MIEGFTVSPRTRRRFSEEFPSSVTQCKELYRRSSKIQRAMLRVWMW